MYERDSSMMLLAHEEVAVIVDLTLCLDPSKAAPWLNESNSILTVIGTLEELEVCCHEVSSSALADTRLKSPYQPPVLPLHTRPVEVDLQLVLRAISIRECPSLDLELWSRAISLREQQLGNVT